VEALYVHWAVTGNMAVIKDMLWAPWSIFFQVY
jgi:hypothetical protein